MRPKYGQADLDIILLAQQGNRDAQIQVFEQYKKLLHKILSQRGITPWTVGRAQYEDFVGDAQVVFFERVLPGYEPEAGAFSTWMTKILNNEITSWHQAEQTQKRQRQEVPLDVPLGEEGEGLTLEEVLPNISTTGINPYVQLMLNAIKESLDDVHRLILDYVVMGYSFREITKMLNEDPRFGEENRAKFDPATVTAIKQNLSPSDQLIFDYYKEGYEPAHIASALVKQQVVGPRGEQFDAHAVSVRLSQVIRPSINQFVEGGEFNSMWVKRQWSATIAPLLERTFPEEMREVREPRQRVQYEKFPELYPPEPAYRINPETGERTLISPELIEASQKLSLRKKAILNIVDFLRIHLNT